MNKDFKNILNKNAHYIIIAVLVVLITKLYFFDLGSRQFWSDEYLHVFAAKSLATIGKPLLLSGKAYTRSILYTYLVAFSYKLFGVSEFTSRLPSIIIALFLFIAVFITTNKQSKKIYVAIIATLFLAADPVFYWWARACRMYILQSFVFFISALFFYYVFEGIFNKKKTGKDIAAIILNVLFFIASFAIAFSVQPLTVLFLPAMVIYPFAHPKSKFSQKKLGIFAISMGVLTFLFVFVQINISQINTVWLSKTALEMFIPLNFKNMITHQDYYLKIFMKSFLIIIPFFIFGVYVSFKKRNSFLILCSLTSITILTMLSTIFAFITYNRFLLFVLPFFNIVAAVGAYYLYESAVQYFQMNEKNTRLFAISLIVLGALFGKANLDNLKLFNLYDNSDYRGGSQYLLTSSEYNKNQIVISTLPLATIYYLKDTDFWLRQKIDKKFLLVKNNVRYELYSNVPMISDPKELSNLLKKRKVWLVAEKKRLNTYLKSDMRSIVDNQMEPVAQFSDVYVYVNKRYAQKIINKRGFIKVDGNNNEK
jgi:hypothetical protein